MSSWERNSWERRRGRKVREEVRMEMEDKERDEE